MDIPNELLFWLDDYATKLDRERIGKEEVGEINRSKIIRSLIEDLKKRVENKQEEKKP